MKYIYNQMSINRARGIIIAMPSVICERCVFDGEVLAEGLADFGKGDFRVLPA